MLIFCDGLDYQKIRSSTLGWHPEIFTLSDPVEGVSKIENLLDPTTTEMFYQLVFLYDIDLSKSNTNWLL